MYLVAIAWMYVVLMMSVAEATSSQGTVLGALVTFGLYGLLPLSIVMYLLGTPMRRRARLAREAQAERAALADAAAAGPPSAPPDGGSQASGDAIPPVRKEP
ncbi:hypothetical protein MW290_19585 [Aquincola tertiaricarbonis]|uniref:Transmembrane protein n=1 Tax=Aquincola tertiaricarbonis TaxID=391953 RepID=A0ABY4SJ61_AQUTE|nr:hypothetical protein [Aquincola tertiaricarbonis]URI11868.1 hypothetical protein MW290_19585 [Aquincola tertiaricarbonis]